MAGLAAPVRHHRAAALVREHAERRHAREDRREARPRAGGERRVRGPDRPDRPERAHRPDRERGADRPDRKERVLRPERPAGATSAVHAQVVGAGLPATRSLSHPTTSSCAATITVPWVAPSYAR